MRTIEDIKQGFLEYAQTETNLVGTLPIEKEDAVALIEYMKDKCASIALWDGDTWWEYKWEPYGDEIGWQDNDSWDCRTSMWLVECDFTRVKFLGVKPKEQWT